MQGGFHHHPVYDVPGSPPSFRRACTHSNHLRNVRTGKPRSSSRKPEPVAESPPAVVVAADPPVVDIPIEDAGTVVSEVIGAVVGSGADAAAKPLPDNAGDGAAPMDVTLSDSAAAAAAAPSVAAGETAEKDSVAVVAADASRIATKRPEPEAPTAATAPEPAAKKPRGTAKTAAGADTLGGEGGCSTHPTTLLHSLHHSGSPIPYLPYCRTPFLILPAYLLAWFSF